MLVSASACPAGRLLHFWPQRGAVLLPSYSLQRGALFYSLPSLKGRSTLRCFSPQMGCSLSSYQKGCLPTIRRAAPSGPGRSARSPPPPQAGRQATPQCRHPLLGCGAPGSWTCWWSTSLHTHRHTHQAGQRRGGMSVVVGMVSAYQLMGGGGRCRGAGWQGRLFGQTKRQCMEGPKQQ